MIKQIPTLDGYEIAKSVPAAFTGGTAARGDKDTASGAWTIFHVNGDVVVRIFGVSTLTPVGTSGTLEVGVAGNTAALIALTTATGIVTNYIWSDASPTAGLDTLASVLGPYIIVNGQDIIETTKTTDLTAGNIYYVCMWKPLTEGSDARAIPIASSPSFRYDTA